MKKIAVFSAFFLLAIVATAAADTAMPALRHQHGRPVKTDTLQVPVIYYQATDTLKMTFVYAKRHRLKTQEGYVLYTGWKNSTNTWVKTPSVRVFTLKWKPFKEKVLSANP